MINIIIVTYNAKDKLKRCLESVEKYTKGISYLLTIVDNHSTDGTFEFLKNYKKGNIKVINTKKNLGFCGGANFALRNTHNKFIVLLDDDAEASRGWLTRLYKSIKNEPNVGIVGCKINFPNNRIHCADYRVKRFQLVGWNEIDGGQRDYIRECDALIGPCWLMRRDLIENVGYFDERFFPSRHEDIDYCLRARLAGYKIIYNGRAKVIHHHLCRYGADEQNRKNTQKFLKKWKNLLHKFPLKDSHPVDKYITAGVDCIDKKRFNRSLIEFEKAESIDKRFSEPFYKAMALEGMGRYDDAIRQFKKVLKLSPANFLAHYRIALLYKKVGLPKEAKRESAKTFNLISPYRKFLSSVF